MAMASIMRRRWVITSWLSALISSDIHERIEVGSSRCWGLVVVVIAMSKWRRGAGSSKGRS